jgi:hypothetical protein
VSYRSGYSGLLSRVSAIIDCFVVSLPVHPLPSPRVYNSKKGGGGSSDPIRDYTCPIELAGCRSNSSQREVSSRQPGPTLFRSMRRRWSRSPRGRGRPALVRLLVIDDDVHRYPVRDGRRGSSRKSVRASSRSVYSVYNLRGVWRDEISFNSSTRIGPGEVARSCTGDTRGRLRRLSRMSGGSAGGSPLDFFDVCPMCERYGCFRGASGGYR